MQSLHEMQRGFASALFDGSGKGVPLVRANGLSPARRLGFYRTNVFGNYHKALVLSYRVVQRMVGQAYFATLAKRYIERYAFGHGDLTQFGDQFAEFLGTEPVSRQLPYLPDLARLEWAMEEVFAEADHPGLTPQRLHELPLDVCDQLRFLLHPATRLLTSAYPVSRIWRLGNAADGVEASLDISGQPECLLVWRDGLEVTLEPLDSASFTMLSALSRGESFGVAFDQAESKNPGFDAGGFLRRYVADRVLADYTCPAHATPYEMNKA